MKLEHDDAMRENIRMFYLTGGKLYDLTFPAMSTFEFYLNLYKKGLCLAQY